MFHYFSGTHIVSQGIIAQGVWRGGGGGGGGLLFNANGGLALNYMLYDMILCNIKFQKGRKLDDSFFRLMLNSFIFVLGF